VTTALTARARVVAQALGELPRWLAAVGRGLAARPRPHGVVLAMLAGPPTASEQTPVAFLVRTVNTTDRARTTTIALDGHVVGRPETTFRASWTAEVPGRASREDWVVTSWRGDATVRAEPTPDVGFPTGGPVGRWTVAASVDGGTSLIIEGSIHR
jgi:hypothetical protein